MIPANTAQAVKTKSLCSENTVASIAQTRKDIGMLIELTIDRAGVDMHIGISFKYR